MSEPAEQIAVTMLRAAYAHLPAETVAGAIVKADLEPMVRILTAITVTAYEEGRKRGVTQGRLELEKEMEEDWRPVAERIRAGAGSPSYDDLEQRWRETGASTYFGGPVEKW
jgi:hypothetical protein